MTVNIEKAITWFRSRKGKVTYSMQYRNGPDSYDCSSAIYYALRSAGASDYGYAVSTETEHGWLLINGYKLLAQNKSWEMEAGDVIIWGIKGQSAGTGGHTMLALDDRNVIHCTAAVNGITINVYDEIYRLNAGRMGGPYVYVYRRDESSTTGDSKPNDVFRQHGNRFTLQKPIKVDAVKLHNGIWQFINFDLAGVIQPTNKDWTENGLPLAIAYRVDGGSNSNVSAGAVVKLQLAYSYGTIDRYQDFGRQYVGIIFGSYGMIWFNSEALLNRF